MLPREGESRRQEALQARRRIVPPRPEYLSIALASLAGTVVFLVAGDIASTLASWIIVFLLVFPIAFIVREVVVLSGTRRISEADALKVFEWVTRVARAAMVKRAILLYAYRDRNEVQLVSFGEMARPTRREQADILMAIYKAAWLARPVPVASRNNRRALIVVPGLVFEKLSSLIKPHGSKPALMVRNRSEARLVYHVLKSLYSATGLPREIAAYSAVKLFRKLLLEGLVVVAPEAVDSLEKSLPFENPLVRRRVQKQLEIEEGYAYEQAK